MSRHLTCTSPDFEQKSAESWVVENVSAGGFGAVVHQIKADWLRVAAILIKPFLPRTAETFYRSFNFEEITAWDRVSYADAAAPLTAHELRVTAPITSGKPAPLFPKVELR